ncbi:hypothetical protein BY996DRAFT_6504553 [Phakopsora pachyrhizi]|nr:hypothetical protein BY996DRAFT_6504553 [Phakopsora pachyrhizi]
MLHWILGLDEVPGDRKESNRCNARLDDGLTKGFPQVFRVGSELVVSYAESNIQSSWTMPALVRLRMEAEAEADDRRHRSGWGQKSGQVDWRVDEAEDMMESEEDEDRLEAEERDGEGDFDGDGMRVRLAEAADQDQPARILRSVGHRETAVGQIDSQMMGRWDDGSLGEEAFVELDEEKMAEPEGFRLPGQLAAGLVESDSPPPTSHHELKKKEKEKKRGEMKMTRFE